MEPFNCFISSIYEMAQKKSKLINGLYLINAFSFKEDARSRANIDEYILCGLTNGRSDEYIHFIDEFMDFEIHKHELSKIADNSDYLICSDAISCFWSPVYNVSSYPHFFTLDCRQTPWHIVDHVFLEKSIIISYEQILAMNPRVYVMTSKCVEKPNYSASLYEYTKRGLNKMVSEISALCEYIMKNRRLFIEQMKNNDSFEIRMISFQLTSAANLTLKALSVARDLGYSNLMIKYQKAYPLWKVLGPLSLKIYYTKQMRDCVKLCELLNKLIEVYSL